MDDRFYLTVLLYLHEDQAEQFHQYEQRIKSILESYGGRFERVLKPTQVSGDMPLPDEVHWLSFPSEADFQQYRTDTRLAQLAPLRSASVQKTVVISGAVIQIFSE
jgi:uncharacterized protein (DUF1330 family)